MEANMSVHIVMFPWLAFGHLIPFLNFAKSLAQKGNKISFISTPRNIQRLPKIPQNLSSLLEFIEITLPKIENLPESAESTTDLSLEKVPYLKKAYDGLESAVADFLQTSSPDWLIYDFASHWLPPIAAKLDVPCAFLSIFNASSISFFGSPSCLMGLEDARTKPEDFTAPPKWVPFDNNLAFRLFEINRMFDASVLENESGVSDGFRFGKAILGCDVVAVRSCTEFESEWLDFLQEKLYRKPVLPIGLLPPQMDCDITPSEEEDETWSQIKTWLDKQSSDSVIYVAFGSEASLSQPDLTELALGLELSGLPFFWVLRNLTGSSELELPVGFEDRVSGRGMVWKGWVPQMKILSHRATGGSLMHSGVSSVVETLGFGYPLVLLPMVNDQALVARLLTWKKIGFEIPRNELDGLFTRESVSDSLRRVMVEKDGEEYRNAAKHLKNVFGNLVLHDNYIDAFSSYLIEHRRVKSEPRKQM